MTTEVEGGARSIYVPPGGFTGQVLTKLSNNNYDDGWADSGISTVPFFGHRVRGFNLATQSDLAPQDFIDMKAYGANSARAGIQCTVVGGVFALSEAQLAYMDQVVEAGEVNDFSVIITLQTIPLGDDSIHWGNPVLESSLVALWQFIAARYRGNRRLAYDLLNEPKEPRHWTVPVGSIDYWTPLATRMIEAIRAIDPQVPIVYEASPIAQPTATLAVLPFERIVYSFHSYLPMEVTHQGISGWPASVNYPSATYTEARTTERLAAIIAFQRANPTVPIYVGEFSCINTAPGNTAANFLSDQLRQFEMRGWHWTYHAFREYSGWDAEAAPALISLIEAGCKGRLAWPPVAPSPLAVHNPNYAGGAVTTSEVTVPGGAKDGAVMLWVQVLTAGSEPATPTAPVGWAICTGFPYTVSVAGFFYKVLVYWRVGTASEPATYTLTHASAGTQKAIYAVGNAARKEPKITINGQSVSGSADATATGLTTNMRSPSLVTFIGMGGTSGRTPAVPAGSTPAFIERSNPSASLLSFSDGVVAANVATGNKTQTGTNASSTGAWAAFLVEFEPMLNGDGTVISYD
jgi:hypothetical protein